MQILLKRKIQFGWNLNKLGNTNVSAGVSVCRGACTWMTGHLLAKSSPHHTSTGPIGACRIRQEMPCDGCVSGGNLRLCRCHNHGSRWLSAKPIRAECCSNKLFIIIPDGEKAADSHSGPINGQVAACWPPYTRPARSPLPKEWQYEAAVLQGHYMVTTHQNLFHTFMNGSGTGISEFSTNNCMNGASWSTLRVVNENKLKAVSRLKGKLDQHKAVIGGGAKYLRPLLFFLFYFKSGWIKHTETGHLDILFKRECPDCSQPVLIHQVTGGN